MIIFSFLKLNGYFCTIIRHSYANSDNSDAGIAQNRRACGIHFSNGLSRHGRPVAIK